MLCWRDSSSFFQVSTTNPDIPGCSRIYMREMWQQTVKLMKPFFFFQVLPKTKIANLKALTPEHLPLLNKMYDQAKELTKGV